MNEEQYLNERLEDQIGWYDKKSQYNQKRYKYLRTAEIIMAIMIPFLAGHLSDKTPSITLTIGILGVFIAVISGIISLNKFQELWIEYRTTCESLRHQKYLFMTKAKPYDQDEAFHLLVENVERLISKEHSKWSDYIKKVEKENDHG